MLDSGCFCSNRDKFHYINLESADGREKDVQDIGVYREFEKCVVTLLVMSIFSSFLVMRHSDASRACPDFRDPIAESRFNLDVIKIQLK